MTKKINSREKGAAGEREFANICKAKGFTEARRGQQYSGANGDADVVGLPFMHIEVKRVERLNVSNAIKQAKEDARKREIPLVAHRKNREGWLITMELDEWFLLYEAFLNETKEKGIDDLI